MIDIGQLDKSHLGAWVKYTSFNNEETGRIKSFNDKWIFVVFKCAGEWDNFNDYTAAACNPKDLEFTEKPVIENGEDKNSLYPDS